MKRANVIAVLVGLALVTVFIADAAAMYNPTLGRFMQRDPLGYVDGMSEFEAHQSDPLDLNDPSGLAAGRGPTTVPSLALSFRTVLEPLPGNCGVLFRPWRVQWQLDGQSTRGGYIIQHVEVTADIKDCDGHAVNFDTSDWRYWEAWRVEQHHDTTTIWRLAPDADDNYAIFEHEFRKQKQAPKPGKCTTGLITMTGRAEFYEGLTLPADFRPEPGTPSGNLPKTKKDPGGLTGGTGSVLHQMTIKWNCCPKNHVEKSTISHNN